MKKIALLISALFLLPLAANATDLANGKAINKSCALCHGAYGQGTPGRLSPRLAGLPKEYLFKATKEYRDGQRSNPLMVTTSGLDTMSDSDIEDVSDYLSRINLSKDPQFDIAQVGSNPENGKELYNDECKTCHARDGYGKPKKEAPPLAGQHNEYLFTTMKLFKADNRIHDNEPEDDLFDEYTDEQLMDITAYLATLDDAKIVENGEIYMPDVKAVAKAPAKDKKASGLKITDITQTVAQMPLNDDVSKEDAIDAMMSKAAELNLKLVGQQHVSKELEARDVESPYLAIFQFCDPMDARTMVVSNPIFASYMPCRIALVEDQEGQPTLMMLNLDMLINSKLLAPEVVETAIRVNQAMLDIMVAGATGEF